MSDVQITVLQAGFDALVDEEVMRSALLAEGERVAALARELAPKRTGAGAASITAEAERGADGWEVHISWDTAHQYMAAQRSSALQDATAAAASL